MFRSAYNAGFATVWNNGNDEPINPRPDRVSTDADWLEGYDEGVKCADLYADGHAVGLSGKDDTFDGDKNYRHIWVSGWYAGYSTFVRAKLKPILKDKLNLVVNEVSYPDYDDITGTEYRGRNTYKRLKRSELLDTVVNYLAGDRYGKNEDIPTDVEGIKKVYLNSQESDFGHTRLLSVKEMKQEKNKQEYERMERKAQAFAATSGKKMGTMQFLQALDRAVNDVRYQRERWNDGETRMEEWGACMYSGGGSESYFDDLNYVNGKYESQQDDLEAVYHYIERKFPLLFMRYQERKERKKKTK